MARRHYRFGHRSPSSTPRARRPKGQRPKVSINIKPAKSNGTCLKCRGRWSKGEDIAHVWTTERKYHQGCCPSMDELQVNADLFPAKQAAAQRPLTAKEASIAALAQLEAALVAKATEQGITPDMERSFSKYQKIKALALRGATPGEEAAAIRMAVLEAVKLVF